MPPERGRGRRALLAVVLAASGAAVVSACTLVSGWADLQDGRRDDEDGGTASSSSGSSGGGDSGEPSDNDGSSGTSDATSDAPSSRAYVCGAAPCSGATMGCCVEDFETPRCTTPAECATHGGFWIGCDRTSACAKVGGACCWDPSTETARCRSACDIDQIPICHPDEGDCKAPKHCNPAAGGVKDLYQCN